MCLQNDQREREYNLELISTHNRSVTSACSTCYVRNVTCCIDPGVIAVLLCIDVH